MQGLGVSPIEIDIRPSPRQMLKDLHRHLAAASRGTT
jgi:hypothetical protein